MPVFLISCSSGNDASDTVTDTAYFSLKSGSFWTYNVPENEAGPAGRDSLYTASDTLIGAVTYKKFKTKDQPFGFYSNSLNGNSLRKSGDKLLLTGAASLNFQATLPINLALSDFVIFKESAADNEVIGTFSGTMTQTLQGLPLLINYILKATAISTLPTYVSPDGTVYTDVKSVKTTLNLEISAVNENLPVPIPVMAPQDVVTSTQYYAKNIGMVYAHTVVAYHLEDFSGLGTLPIPQSASQTQEEFLDTYHIEQ
jgi:hypothetical protein